MSTLKPEITEQGRRVDNPVNQDGIILAKDVPDVYEITITKKYKDPNNPANDRVVTIIGHQHYSYKHLIYTNDGFVYDKDEHRYVTVTLERAGIMPSFFNNGSRIYLHQFIADIYHNFGNIVMYGSKEFPKPEKKHNDKQVANMKKKYGYGWYGKKSKDGERDNESNRFVYVDFLDENLTNFNPKNLVIRSTTSEDSKLSRYRLWEKQLVNAENARAFERHGEIAAYINGKLFDTFKGPTMLADLLCIPKDHLLYYAWRNATINTSTRLGTEKVSLRFCFVKKTMEG